MLEQVADYCQSLGYEVRGVIADHWAAAWALAVYGDLTALPDSLVRGGPGPLRSGRFGRDHEARPNRRRSANCQSPRLRVDADTCQKFADLGIERIEQVWQLPADSLPARFGSELNWRLAEMAGESKEKIQVCAAETTFHSWRNLGTRRPTSKSCSITFATCWPSCSRESPHCRVA